MKNNKIKRVMSSTITGTMLLGVFPSVVSASTNSLADDFEGSINDDYWFEEVPSKTSIQPSTNYSQSGTHSLRVELNKTDINVNGSKRAEIRIAQDSPMSESPLEEHTYTFYTMLPGGGDEDYQLDTYGSDIIAQWHNQPDENEEWTSPPLSLSTYNGNYIIGRCWDDAAITSNTQMLKKGNSAEHNLGSYINDKGKWVKWEFHVKWGWLSSQDPKLEVYKNGVQVLNCNGLPNTTNDKLGVVMKLGIYKWNWAQSDDQSILKKRVIYYDNVSISSVNTSGTTVTKNDLQALYDKNKNRTQGNYTGNSWSKFTSELNNANLILLKANVTQSEVTTANKNLQAAIKGLVTSSSSNSNSGSDSADNNNDNNEEESSSDSSEIKIISNNKIEEITTSKIDINKTSNSDILSKVKDISGKITKNNNDDSNAQVQDIYRVISDTFKGYATNISLKGKNYIYISSESAANSINSMEINTSDLNDSEKYVYSVDNVTNNLVLISSYGLNEAKNDMIKITPKSGMQYLISDNKLETLKNNQWVKIDNEWSYVKDGQAVTGWYKSLANQWYYMNSKGIMQKGWINDNGTWYYLRSDGVMETGWIQDNGKWYHLSNSGAMDIGWIKEDTTWYHLSSSGAMDIGWIKDNNGKWYYLYSNGAMACNTNVNGYKLDKNGVWIQ